jgi:hypothetical protein
LRFAFADAGSVTSTPLLNDVNAIGFPAATQKRRRHATVRRVRDYRTGHVGETNGAVHVVHPMLPPMPSTETSPPFTARSTTLVVRGTLNASARPPKHRRRDGDHAVLSCRQKRQPAA